MDEEAPPIVRQTYYFSPIEGWVVWCPKLEVWHLALSLPPPCKTHEEILTELHQRQHPPLGEEK